MKVECWNLLRLPFDFYISLRPLKKDHYDKVIKSSKIALLYLLFAMCM